MSTESTKPAAGTPSVETSVSADRTTHYQDGSVNTQNDEGVSAQFDGKDVSEVRTGLGDLQEGADSDDEQGGSEGTGEEGGAADEGSEGDQEGKGLPDWDPANPETEAAYDAHYFTKDGDLDVRGVLSQEFWANYRKDPDAFKDPTKGGLDDKTYAYLKDRMGLSKEDVLQVERGQLAIAQQAEQKFYNDVGGKARWEAAVAWGREGGYTKAQQDRFNAALERGGEDAEEAAAALMGRYNQKHPQRDGGGFRKGPPRRHSSPPRDATRGAANGGGQASKDVYKTAAEYNAEISAARKSGDQKEIDRVRAKGKRSNLK